MHRDSLRACPAVKRPLVAAACLFLAGLAVYSLSFTVFATGEQQTGVSVTDSSASESVASVADSTTVVASDSDTVASDVSGEGETNASTEATAQTEEQHVSLFEKVFGKFIKDFKFNFVEGDRYKYLTKGLFYTLEITFFSVLIGIFLGVIVASVRYTYDESRGTKKKHSLSGVILGFFNAVCKVYLTVIRGTPVVVQILIIYYVILASAPVSKVFAAVVAFGFNSGAYVAEIVRSGLSSVDRGQLEAGRSLGLGYFPTMLKIIIPQAFKNILPALANEFIVLLKETSVSGYIAINDLTRGGDIIRSITYQAYMPLVAIALIYLSLVMVLSAGVTKLERRLKRSDRR